MAATKHLILGAVIIALFAGALMAISGASVTSSSSTRWAGQTAGSANTEGGNITIATISATVLTDRWSAYLGNITGNLILGTDASRIYSWSYTLVSNNATVCVAQNPASGFASVLNASAVSVNANFTMGYGTDNATQTMNITSCTLTLASTTLTGVTAARHQGNSTFTTCAVSTEGTNTNSSLAFCTNVSTVGKAFNNEVAGTANYEIMVPTLANAGTETYYFYVELG